MFMDSVLTRRDVAETLLMTPPLADLDPLEQMAQAERADRGLLIVVAAAAAATLLLALAASLA
jgi:hypothetical protein